jgi:ubiquinone/menaquinone biosynthesis C-methylase UbiE
LNLKNVNVRNADFADLPYEDNFFDAVFCFGALVHTLKFNEVFNEFNRVLKPEGILIIDFDNKYGFIRFFIDFFEILISFFDKKTRKRRQENRKIYFFH